MGTEGEDELCVKRGGEEKGGEGRNLQSPFEASHTGR